MMQTLVVIALFLAAGLFLGKRIFAQFAGKKQTGCEKCASNQIVNH